MFRPLGEGEVTNGTGSAFKERVSRGPRHGPLHSPRVAVLNRRSEIIRQDRLNRAKLEIAERIRCVCTEMPAEEFDVLVSHMAEVQIKYTLRRSGDLFPDGGAWREDS